MKKQNILDDEHVKMFKPCFLGGINIKELQEGYIKVIYFAPFSGLLQKNVIELQLVSELFGLLLRQQRKISDRYLL